MTTSITMSNYDFRNGFINPTIQNDQIVSENPDFSSMLSLYFRQNVVFHSGSVGKFDVVTYFVHFFLGLLVESKRPFYWYYDEQNRQLKAFLSSEDEKTIKLKCFDFEPQKRKNAEWSELDLKNLIAESGTKMEGATLESHWYDIYVENLVHPDELQNNKRKPVPLRRMVSPEVFFAEKTKLLTIERDFLDKAIKLHRKAPKNFQKLDVQLDNLPEIVVKIIKAKKAERTEKYSVRLANNGRRILENIQNRYKQTSNSFHSSAHCGILHGMLLKEQKSASFLTKIQHTLDNEPPGYRIEFKKLNLDTMINEYPIRIEIPPNLHKAGKRKNQILGDSASAHDDYIVMETLAKEALLVLTNLNADQGFNILVKRLKVAESAYTIVEDILTEVEKNAISKDIDFSRNLNELLEYEIGVILRDDIPLYRPQKLNYLSRYFKGYFAASQISKDGKAFELALKNPSQFENSYMKSYLLKSKTQNVDYIINFYEKDQLLPEDLSLITQTAQNRLYPRTAVDQISDRLIVTDVLVFFTDHYENSKQYLEKIVHTYQASTIKNDQDFRLEPIDHLDVSREMINLELNDGEVYESRMKIANFVDKNAPLLGTGEDLKALFDGLLHKEKRVSNLGADIFQLNFRSKTSAKLFSINLAFGHDARNNFEKLEFVHKSDSSHGLYVSVSKQDEHSKLKTMVLDEKYLSGLIGCMKNLRRRKKDCSKFQELIEVTKETIPTTETKSKIYLKNLNRLSSSVMYGLMAKNLISELINGDLTGLAVNFGFIISSIGAGKMADKLLTKAAALSPVENLIFSNALKIGAPFLRRAPSFLFVGFDLYENIRSISSGDRRSESVVSLGADVTYLALDLAETAIEAGDVLGVGALAGVSAVTGPVMWAAGAAVLLGAEIYKSVKKVERIEEIVHLTKIERVSEGFRAFFGISPEEHVQNLMTEKENLTKILPKMVEFLENHDKISKYVFPIKRQTKQNTNSMIDLRTERKIQIARSIPTGYDYFCQFEETESPKRLNSFLPLTWRIAASFSKSRSDLLGKNSTYLCQNALGLKRRRSGTSDLAYLQLGDTQNTTVYGPLSGITVFDVSGHGQKALYGGEGSNRFLLRGDNSLIYINGPKNAENILDMSNFAVKGPIKYTERFLYYHEKSDKVTYYENVNMIVGRRNFTDEIETWCSLTHVELLGGNLHPDQIKIPDDVCKYNLTVSFSTGDTTLINNAISGYFGYSFGNLDGVTYIRLPEMLEQIHKFSFKYSLFDLQSISTDFSDPKAVNTLLRFNFKNGAIVIIDLLINLDNFEIEFDDGATFLLKNGHGVLHMKSMDTIETIADTYGELLSNSTVSMIATSQVDKQTITITRSSKNVDYGVDLVFNDPDSKHNIKSNLHESIFVIKADENLHMKNVTIHISNYKNIIDVSQLYKQVKNVNLTIKLEPNEDDILIHILSKNFTGTVILKKAMINENYKRIIIYKNCHMRIKIKNSIIFLEPKPLIFDNSRNLVVITTKDRLDMGNEVIFERTIGKWAAYKMENNLILTNILYTLSTNKENAFTLILKDYETSDLMKSLTFSFFDGKFSKKDVNARFEDDFALFLKRIFVEQYAW